MTKRHLQTATSRRTARGLQIVAAGIIGLLAMASAAVYGEAADADATRKARRVLFEDKLAGKLADGWKWVREDPEGWRVGDDGLRIRVQPGGLWGAGNDAKNVLVRKLPEAEAKTIAAEVTLSSKPVGQYEQAGIAWYYDDGNMVKFVKECVNGKTHIVMGREQKDRTRTVALIPAKIDDVQLRLSVTGDKITGQYRLAGQKDWKDAGTCDLPAKGQAKVSLQVYNGPADAERWARFSGFRVLELK